MMRTATAALCVIFALTCASAAHGITWADAKARDPISGRNIKVQEPMSSGSYIYEFPEKYDLVFWPYTDDNWLWFSAASGYIAFSSDFTELTDQQKEPVRDWLKDNYDSKKPPATRIERLRWAEKIYAQRDKDDDFWCYFYRLMAFELKDDEAASLAYIRKATPLLEKRLTEQESPNARAETLYLLGEYNRRLGNRDAARDFFAKVRVAPYTDSDGKEAIGSPYLIRLVVDREALMQASQ